MKRKKVRKESGRKYNKFYNPEQGQYYEIHWDDWNDYRDGYRNLHYDKTLKTPDFIAKEHWCNTEVKDFSVNDKINKLLGRRKIMKYSNNIKTTSYE